MKEKIKFTKREQRAVIENLKKFEKRSKLIKIVYSRAMWGHYKAQINISKENKVVLEMINYLKTLCSFVEEENNGTLWLRNYDDLAIEENDNWWDLEFEFCIHKTF